MSHSRDPVDYDGDTVVHHVSLRHRVLGIKVKLMLPWYPSGKIGPKESLPARVNIVETKDEILPTTSSQNRRMGSQSRLPCPSQGL